MQIMNNKQEKKSEEQRTEPQLFEQQFAEENTNPHEKNQAEEQIQFEADLKNAPFEADAFDYPNNYSAEDMNHGEELAPNQQAESEFTNTTEEYFQAENNPSNYQEYQEYKSENIQENEHRENNYASQNYVGVEDDWQPISRDQLDAHSITEETNKQEEYKAENIKQAEYQAPTRQEQEELQAIPSFISNAFSNTWGSLFSNDELTGNGAQNKTRKQSQIQLLRFPDPVLILAVMMLSCIGIVMVGSAAAPEKSSYPLFYFYRQFAYCFIGILAAVSMVLFVPAGKIEKHYGKICFAGLVLLALIFVPGLGVTIKGAKRWLNLGVSTFQSAEAAKLAIIIFTAGFLCTHRTDLHFSDNAKLLPHWNFIRVCIMFAIVLVMYFCLLELQHDLGSIAVICASVIMMFYLFGIPTRILVVPIVALIAIGYVLVSSQGYRVARFSNFMHPCDDAYGTGYQLCNSLIAIGRGGFSGTGLGESVFKHNFIPEQYTDFIFAIIAEEFGFVGCIILIAIYALLVWRIFVIAARASKNRMMFGCYCAYGIGAWLGIQSALNIAVATGILPTKGLTLPFISYGGSSIFISAIAIGILLRIDAEARYASYKRRLQQGKITVIA